MSDFAVQNLLYTLLPSLSAPLVWIPALLLAAMAACAALHNNNAKKRHIVVPQFTPPRGMGPGAMYFVYNFGKYHHQGLGADLLHFAAKRAVKLVRSSERSGRIHSIQALPDAASKLSPAEQTVFNVLFPDGEGELLFDSSPGDENLRPDSRFFAAIFTGYAAYAERYGYLFRPSLFARLHLLTRALLAWLLLLICGLWSHLAVGTFAIWMFLVYLTVAFFFVAIGIRWLRFGRELRGLQILGMAAILIWLVLIYFMSSDSDLEMFTTPPGYSAAFIVTFLAAYFSPRPVNCTPEGHALRADIEGFLMNLDTVDIHRSEILHPEDDASLPVTPAMPYAALMGGAATWASYVFERLNDLFYAERYNPVEPGPMPMDELKDRHKT